MTYMQERKKMMVYLRERFPWAKHIWINGYDGAKSHSISCTSSNSLDNFYTLSARGRTLKKALAALIEREYEVFTAMLDQQNTCHLPYDEDA